MKFLLPGIQFASRYLLSQRAPVQPKLPPELERQIFEICALDCPEFCTTLILVSKRVYEWSVGAVILLSYATYFTAGSILS